MSYKAGEKLLKNMEMNKQKRLIPILEARVRAYAPKECKEMGQEKLDIFLNQSYRDALKHGVRKFGEVKAFTFLTFELGLEFYKDADYLEIVDIFNSASSIDVKLSRAINYYLEEEYRR